MAAGEAWCSSVRRIAERGRFLKAAFNIKTVGDLAKNKQFRAAQLIAGLAEADAR
jgi:hypothetical protein